MIVSGLPFVPSECPEKCKCVQWRAKVSVSCSVSKLNASSVAKLILPIETTNVRIKNTNVTSLRAGNMEFLKKLTNLTSLVLRYNNIEVLKREYFMDVKMLTYLYLNHNNLKEIPVSVLELLPHLTTLSLINNTINTIPANACKYNFHLRYLYIQESIISCIHSGKC